MSPLKLKSAAEVIAELEESGNFRPAKAFYAGHMGRAYDQAMSVVAKDRHYVKLREDETYLDPTTEAHESLHGMSSLIRNARGESISAGYDVIYVGDGSFAEIRLSPGFTKAKLRRWLPRGLRSSDVARTHINDSRFSKAHVALIAEELAYHVLDGRIGLENHSYMEEKLGIKNAVTAPAAEWSILALATAAMLDTEPDAFPAEVERRQFNALVKRLVEDAVSVYARGMDGGKYGMLANLAPELRGQFTTPLAEDSRQAREIRDFCSRTFGEDWLETLRRRVEQARDSTEALANTGIYSP
ncbi:MAG: hypothetical protein U0790_09330 [Isosphaeraceae bacterium]